MYEVKDIPCEMFGLLLITVLVICKKNYPVIQIEETPESKEELHKLKETFILSDKAKKFMMAQKLMASSTFFDYFTNVL